MEISKRGPRLLWTPKILKREIFGPPGDYPFNPSTWGTRFLTLREPLCAFPKCPPLLLGKPFFGPPFFVNPREKGNGPNLFHTKRGKNRVMTPRESVWPFPKRGVCSLSKGEKIMKKGGPFFSKDPPFCARGSLAPIPSKFLFPDTSNAPRNSRLVTEPKRNPRGGNSPGEIIPGNLGT